MRKDRKGMYIQWVTQSRTKPLLSFFNWRQFANRRKINKGKRFFEFANPHYKPGDKLQLSIITLYDNWMDIWSFPTQGTNYEKYRPQYPRELCGQALEPLEHREKYLDIAVGTGKILLSFCESFKEAKGIDLSENMLSVAQANVLKFKETHPQNTIILEKHHVMELKEEERFDLVTVGQALHFFPVEQALNKIKNMLNEGGMLMVFGYVLREVHSNNPKENDYFYEFYDQMLSYFTFDMYDLHKHYSEQEKYPFERVFDKVERKQADLVIKMSRQDYINYLKTWSAYNLFVTTHGVDPILPLIAQSAEEVTCVFDYFRIRCFK